MNRRYLALGAAVVLAAVIGLYVAIRPTGDQPGSAARPARIDLPEVSQAAPGKPRKTPDGAVAVPPARTGTTEYTVGETRIRDHRSGEHARAEIPPPSHPPEGRRIASQVTSDLGQQVRPLLRQCTAGLPPGSLTDKSRVDGEIIIAIKDHQATVTAAAFQPRDVAEAALADVKQCLTQRAVGLTAPAGDEADVDGYGITLSLALR